MRGAPGLGGGGRRVACLASLVRVPPLPPPQVLSFGAINMAMMALMKTLDMLGRERHVVHRERSRGQLGSGLGLGLG